MIAFWGVGFFLVFSLVASFPEAKHLTFFSSTQIAGNETESLVNSFITANVIQTIAEGAVPAVVLFSIFFGVIYAFSDEFHQYFVPGRSADLFDFIADCIGVILVQVIIWFYFRSKSHEIVRIHN